MPRDPADARPCRARWRWRSPATSTRSTICACSNICKDELGAVAGGQATPGTRHWVDRGAGRAGGDGRAARRRLPVRRRADPRRRLPGAAALQCAALRRAARRLIRPCCRADENASALEAFAAAHPDRQEQCQHEPRRHDQPRHGRHAAARAGRDPVARRARSATRNGRSASISPPPTGWSPITAGTTSSSPICRRASRGPSIISCSIPTI